MPLRVHSTTAPDDIGCDIPHFRKLFLIRRHTVIRAALLATKISAHLSASLHSYFPWAHLAQKRSWPMLHLWRPRLRTVRQHGSSVNVSHFLVVGCVQCPLCPERYPGLYLSCAFVSHQDLPLPHLIFCCIATSLVLMEPFRSSRCPRPLLPHRTPTRAPRG